MRCISFNWKIMAMLPSLTMLLLVGLYGLSMTQTATAKQYTAAAFEHKPYFTHDGSIPSRQEALRRMKVNTAVYGEQARIASKHGAQIIVFPEDGLYGIGNTRDGIEPFLEPIPDVSKSPEPWVPCTNPKKIVNTEILQELSCIAMNNSIALVANMGDIKYCAKTDPHCPPDGRYQFNTDVVFDTDGRLLAKYHKQNLFHEEQFNTPLQCEFVTFTTSFRVRFGVFTCFDLLFKSPAVDLVRVYGVRNIAFPTAWFDGYPLLKAIQYQQAWSRTNCVNFIAANLLIPVLDFSGSGIYACGEVKAYTYRAESSENRLLVATLSDSEANAQVSEEWETNYSNENIKHERIKHQTTQTNEAEHVFQTTKTFKARVLNDLYTLTKLVLREGELSVCGDGMCCRLEYKISDAINFTESFALGAFKGHHNPEGFFLEVCVLFKCLSSDEESCGKVVEQSETVFQSFRLTGNFSSQASVYPGVLSSGVKLSQPDVVEFTGDGITSKHFGKTLLTAALVGRVYSKDKPNL